MQGAQKPFACLAVRFQVKVERKVVLTVACWVGFSIFKHLAFNDVSGTVNMER